MHKIKTFLKNKATERNNVLKTLKKNDPAIILATWFGSGYIFPAPGFWGTLASLPLGIFLLVLASPLTLAVVTIFIFFLGLWAAHKFETQSQSHDSSMIVIDETAGILLTLLFASPNGVSILLAFILFRIFDTLKPWPISYLDKKIGGAFGVMIDDILAGLLAGLCLLGLKVYGGIG